MFNNFINPTEVIYLLRRMRVDFSFRRSILNKLRFTTNSRVRTAWAHTTVGPSGWWEIPAVQRRWNFKISGDNSIPYQQYVTRKYFPSVEGLSGLSIGCGTGEREIEWARTGKFRNIDAYDISPERIEIARSKTSRVPGGATINYLAADIGNLRLPDSSYDLIIFEHSLHHLSPLDTLLDRVSNVLKPGGHLFANEFVGPSKFQWTERQLKETNSLLVEIPPEYRTFSRSSILKERVIRPSKLRMWISDPSESVESSGIIRLLSKHFDVLETKGYGGSILHLLFSDIAHHFTISNPTVDRLLQRSFDVEDTLITSGDLTDDFAVVICRK
jgi:ubiquinone/menaquinone biosynthesis C-methylase UbiE